MPARSPHPVDVYVGSRLRAARMAAGISQERLAHGLGLTFQQVQKYETGRNRLSASKLVQASNVLRTPVAFFFDGAPGIEEHEDPIVVSAAPLFQTASGVRIAQAFPKIAGAKVRAKIVDLVEEIAGGAP